MKNIVIAGAMAASSIAVCVPLGAQQTAAAQRANGNGAAAPAVPRGYVIGAEDILTIVFWRDKELGGEVVVRPDGRISLPLLNDVPAAGYTPEELRGVLEEAASKFVAEPSASVIVKEIHSRKVFVLGQVGKPGTVPLTSEMNVLQLIASVGGLLEYADKGNITIVRQESGRERRFKFNYNDVVKGKKLQQNIKLQPGDTVIVR